MQRKARKHNNGNCETILERWHDDDKHRTSLSDIGWTEEQIIQYDAVALEDHSYVATRQVGTENPGKFIEQRRYSRTNEKVQ